MVLLAGCLPDAGLLVLIRGRMSLCEIHHDCALYYDEVKETDRLLFPTESPAASFMLDLALVETRLLPFSVISSMMGQNMMPQINTIMADHGEITIE